jgi:hypothetical protein
MPCRRARTVSSAICGPQRFSGGTSWSKRSSRGTCSQAMQACLAFWVPGGGGGGGALLLWHASAGRPLGPPVPLRPHHRPRGTATHLHGYEGADGAAKRRAVQPALRHARLPCLHRSNGAHGLRCCCRCAPGATCPRTPGPPPRCTIMPAPAASPWGQIAVICGPRSWRSDRRLLWWPPLYH